jgi:glucan phosphorylase
MIKPEQMSLSAHAHIQNILDRGMLTSEDMNAVYRLAQHLRVFGLLSATGYINQNNQQEGKIKERIPLIWKSLLAQLLAKDVGIEPKLLMKEVFELAQNKPELYMLQWQRALALSHHWNFWARAYSTSDDL